MRGTLAKSACEVGQASPKVAMTAGPGPLAEGERQQARAQQHEAGRGQREESVGDQIVIAHVTPAM